MLVLNSCQLPVAFSAAFLLLFNNRRKEVSMKHSQLGRSMIEILGVLAIIAVLSVGGIDGFSKAMEKYKTTKLMNEYSELIRNLLEYRPNFEKNYPNTVDLKNIILAAGLLTAKWHPDYQPAYLRDSAGNHLSIVWDCHNIKPCSYVVVIILGGSGIAYGKKRDKAKRMCMQIFQTVIQHLHGMLKIGRGTWALGGSAKPYYGDAYCDSKRQLCLRDMSLADIKASCDSCDVAGRCEVSMYF